MNEKRDKFVSYMNVDFLFGESVSFVNFYPECFRRGKEAKKSQKKGQEGGQKSNKRMLKEGQNEDMISLFHI